MASQRILPTHDRHLHAGVGAAYLGTDVAAPPERELKSRPRSAATRTAALTTLVLGGVLLLMTQLPPHPLLVKLQATQLYKQLSGAALLVYFALQWTLSLARVRHWPKLSRSLFSLHQNLGVFGPALLYLHASKWGFGYLGILTGALFANHALGIMRSGSLLPRWSIGLWTVLHVALSLVLVVLAGYHVWQAYYRE